MTLAPRTARWSLGFVLFVGFALRVVGLDADPPRGLTWSLSPYTDEGYMVHNAKSKLLFGQWLVDDFFRMAVSPLYSLLEYLNFRVFGFGFVQARALSVLFGLAAVLLTFSILERARGARAALLGSALLSTSYLFTMQNRLALEESTMLFFVLLSVWLFLSPSRGALRFFLSGFAAGLAAFFLKLSAVFVFPALLAEALRQRYWVKDSPLRDAGNRPFVLVSLGLASAPLLWILLILLPFGHAAWLMIDANTIHSQSGKPDGIFAVIKLIFTLGTSDHLVVREPMLFLVAALGLVPFLADARRELAKADGLEFMLAVMTVTATILLSTTNYRPLRYQLVFLIPAVLWASVAADRMFREGFTLPRLTPLGLALTAPVVVLIGYNALFALYYAGRNGRNPPGYAPLLVQALLLAALLLAAWWWASRKPPGVLRVGAPRARVGLLVALVCGLGLDFWQYGRWSFGRTYELIELSRDLRRLPSKSLVAGPWASSATMETTIRALPMQPYVHADRVLERFPVTHLLIFEKSWEERFFRTKYPLVLDRSRLVRAYPIAGKKLYLFELPKS